MTKKNDVDFIKEIFEIIILFGLIIIRFLPIGNDNLIIRIAGYLGVLVSLVDLYFESNSNFSKYDKFHVVKGWSYTIFALMAILLLLLLVEIIKISNAWSDVFTLMALLITLPKRLYIQLLGKYICGGIKNENEN